MQAILLSKLRFQFIVFILFLFLANISKGQYLSNLDCRINDPVFTTYAAPLERSDYKLDQAWRLLWGDLQRNVEFVSEDGGNMGLAFVKDGELRNRLITFYRDPVITISYPDLAGFYYYPFRHIRVEVLFDVFSSTQSFADYRIINEGRKDVSLELVSCFYLDGMEEINFSEGCFSFDHRRNRDGWMKSHNIPYQEDLQSAFLTDAESQQFGTYTTFPEKDLLDGQQLNHQIADGAKYLLQSSTIRLKSGEDETIRLMRASNSVKYETGRLIAEAKRLNEVNPEDLIKANEQLFDRIPVIEFHNPDHEAVYWSSFNLIRQCMMPPEGESGYNYYVFSREPKWGWGYGGQVFHESLVMLVYAYMDPESAMNSQRVYMERQSPSGYINYRTGPYLNEQIEYNGELTSSAPWYNWQNFEIYKVTGDKKFLQEAYQSGKLFYNYYVSNRDEDEDGLCNWGAHAILESVRDARVAVWDQVGWPSNFEGPDVNAMLVSEAKALAAMAAELNKTGEAARWMQQANERAELINAILWDEEDGFYYNVDKNSHLFSHKSKDDLKIKEIIGFLPMWAGVADSSKAARLIESLTNPDEFWRKHGVPTLAADEGYYNPIGYWNGPVWVQWDYLVFRALLDYGYQDEAFELANRVLDQMAYHLKKDHVFWEFYSPDDRQAGWNQTYIWAGLAARFLIDMDQSLKTGYTPGP
jgi:hypothetical protein